MGKLVKMKLIAYTDEKYSQRTGAAYAVMLNPESMKWNRSILYNDQQPPDSPKSSSKYRSTPAEGLSFDIVIDCTGVVDKSRVDLPAEIDKLKHVVFEFNGKIHRPNYVGVYWGSKTHFLGVLTNLDVSYTLFKPDGTPIRAKISLKFSSRTDPATAAHMANKCSPDVTHVVNVVAGDTLPQLSQEVLNDSKYFVQIAEFNGLNKFRHLQPGDQLVFPPVVNGATE